MATLVSGSVTIFPHIASAQAGAIGAGVSRTLTGEDLYENAPILANSALVLPRGAWAAGTDFIFAGGIDHPTGASYGLGEILATAFYGATSKLTLGVLARPLVFLAVPAELESNSGLGDVSLDGRYQMWRSDEGRTKVLGLLRLGLPTAKEGLGLNGATVLPGVTATHQLRNVTLNGGVALRVPTDTATTSYFEADAAVVLGVHRNLGLSLEGIGRAGEGDGDFFAIAPGARASIGEHVFAQAAIAVFAAKSSSLTQDYMLLFGLAYAR